MGQGNFVKFFAIYEHTSYYICVYMCVNQYVVIIFLF